MAQSKFDQATNGKTCVSWNSLALFKAVGILK